MLKQEEIRKKYCIELCPGCMNEQVIYAKGITACPDCGYPMAPCSECLVCNYDTCPCGCDGTDADSRKRVTNPPISKEMQAILYELL